MPGSFNYGNTYGYSGGNAYSYNLGQSDSQGSATGQSTSGSQATSASAQDPLLSGFVRNTYQNALDFHGQNYQNILSGYRDTLGSVTNQADRIAGGYGLLNSQIQSQLRNADSARRQEIMDAYAGQSGKARVDLVGRGLGSSTVQNSIDRGLLIDREKALNDLENQGAIRNAGYAAQLGSAGLGAYDKALGITGSLGGQYMGVLGGQNLPIMGWAPNVSSSQSTSQSQATNQSQNQSHAWNQGESWNMNQSQNMGMNYGYSRPPGQYGGGGGYDPYLVGPQGWGGGGDWSSPPVAGGTPGGVVGSGSPGTSESGSIVGGIIGGGTDTSRDIAYQDPGLYSNGYNYNPSTGAGSYYGTAPYGYAWTSPYGGIKI